MDAPYPNRERSCRPFEIDRPGHPPAPGGPYHSRTDGFLPPGVQEAVVKALTKVDTLREPAYLKTWFYRILLNECMNHFRQSRRLVPLETSLDERAAEGRDPGERLDLYDAIGKLSPREQAVIRLRFFEDMKLEEIAQCTGTNLNTVKSRLYKALKKLKEMTGEEIEHES